MVIIFLATLTLLLAVFVALFVIIMLRIRSYYTQFGDFLTAPDDKSMSPASILYGVLIKRLATELKVTIMGTMGGEAKGQSYVEQAAMTDMVSDSNPVAAAVLSAFPSLGKTFKKNPALLNYAISKLSGLKGAPGVPGAPGAASDNGGGFSSNANKYG